MAGGRHELQIVDHNQAQAFVLAMQAACSGTQFERGQCRAFVDEYRRVVQATQRIREARPIVIVQPAGAQLVLIEAAGGAELAHGELRATHLHTENGYRQFAVKGDVLGDV